MRLLRRVAVIATTGLACVSCGSSSAVTTSAPTTGQSPQSTVTESSPPAPPATTLPSPTSTIELAALAPIAGRQWIADSNITVGGLVPVLAGTGAGFRISTDGTIAVNTGCNTGTGRVVALPDATLQVVDLVTTKQACAAGVAELETNVLFILSRVNAWEIRNGTLTLVPINISDVGLNLIPG
jgi:heat shock protein HslJ